MTYPWFPEERQSAGGPTYPPPPAPPPPNLPRPYPPAPPRPNRGAAEWLPFRLLVWLMLAQAVLVMLAVFLVAVYS